MGLFIIFFMSQKYRIRTENQTTSNPIWTKISWFPYFKSRKGSNEETMMFWMRIQGRLETSRFLLTGRMELIPRWPWVAVLLLGLNVSSVGALGSLITSKQKGWQLMVWFLQIVLQLLRLHISWNSFTVSALCSYFFSIHICTVMSLLPFLY